ncbi:MarR family transcriptional regulator [Phenylobacterium sp.]|jgi:DNA-binding MarR family transcriptional regulator|uniref:MarR family winged helix-turn-helix transcriptional regulator n=1 Tax=Phenylobacterium sp. TaxID=1871053 RepID=UPI002F3F11BB
MPKAQSASIDPADEFPFAVDDYLLHLVVAIYQFRDSRLDHALRPLGLNVSRYRVLGVLERFGASTMTELASFTAMQRTTLTRIADQLVAAGFVTRAGEARDRRQVILTLTDEGREAHARALDQVRSLNQSLLGAVPDPERRSAVRVLMQVVDKLAPSRLARDGILHFSREGLEGRSA